MLITWRKLMKCILSTIKICLHGKAQSVVSWYGFAVLIQVAYSIKHFYAWYWSKVTLNISLKSRSKFRRSYQSVIYRCVKLYGIGPSWGITSVSYKKQRRRLLGESMRPMNSFLCHASVIFPKLDETKSDTFCFITFLSLS